MTGKEMTGYNKPNRILSRGMLYYTIGNPKVASDPCDTA